MTRTSEKYQLSPVKEDPKKMSDYCNDPWCFNLILILINCLVILSTAGFLIGREESIKECSPELYNVALNFEIYLGLVVLRYILFAFAHSCGLCESGLNLEPYQQHNRLPSLKRRFTVHLAFSFIDLLILIPFTINAKSVLKSSRARLCGKINEQNLVWIHVS